VRGLAIQRNYLIISQLFGLTLLPSAAHASCVGGGTSGFANLVSTACWVIGAIFIIRFIVILLMSFSKNFDGTKQSLHRINAVLSCAACLILFAAPFLFYKVSLITHDPDDYLTAALTGIAGVLIIVVDTCLRRLIRNAPKSRRDLTLNPVVVGGYALIIFAVLSQAYIFWGKPGNKCCKPIPNNATCGRFMHCDEKGRYGECGVICHTCDAEGNRLFPPK
jgi:hypothetical protein